MWWEKYIGQPYVELENDCMALAVKVAHEFLGLHVISPTYKPDIRDQARAIREHKDDVCSRIETPKDGYPVLFLCRRRFFHIGVYLRTNHEDWILHADERSGFVILTRLKDMSLKGYQLEGFYQWI